jgi:hypothetical protein
MIIADWGDAAHWNRGKQGPCAHCGKLALLLDDASRPAHKVCAQAALAALLAQKSERKST